MIMINVRSAFCHSFCKIVVKKDATKRGLTIFLIILGQSSDIWHIIMSLHDLKSAFLNLYSQFYQYFTYEQLFRIKA